MLNEEIVLERNELKEKKQWICYKTENVGKEEVQIPWDPAITESFELNNFTNWMTFEEAIELQRHSIEKVEIGFVLKEGDPYFSVEILEAINVYGELSEVARETMNILGNCYYAEIIAGKSLIVVLKGSLLSNVHFKNIKVDHFNKNHIVPIKGNAAWEPKSPWKDIDPKKFDEMRQYHYKKNCQVDDNSEQLPEHYVKTNNGLRLLPNVLVSTLLKQQSLLMCNSIVYRREIGDGIFKKMDINEMENEILDYLSPKYLTNKDIEDTKKLLIKRIPKDNGLTSPNRVNGKINFQNGVYDIKSAEFGSYEHYYNTAYQLDVEYDIEAQCPKFLDYIKTSLTAEDIKTVQEMFGYLLTTEIKAHKAFLLYGPGNTGKSTLIELIEKIIGEEYVSNIPFQDLGAKFRTIQLHGKLLNSYGDLPQGNIKDTSTFKALVSGDRMYGDDKFEKGFNFQNTARLLFATNKLPSNLVDQSSGFYRRLILIPFQNVVSTEDIKRDLKDRLYEEREGIAQWALVGLKRLMQNNYVFTISSAAQNLMKEYKKANNSTLWFVDEYCELNIAESQTGKVLYDAYKKVCLDARISPVSQREFNAQIESQFGDKGVTKYQGSQTRAVEFSGIKLK
ncbi:phage/plasmid primase, P4 family [Oceanobacillus oncorhynchi]|uniref:phage/plasmid primase, P4 family n=1 Tax=Oceanobacillus oncorhynchi TaxID=545501 RepID=UPI0034D67441